MRDPQPKNGMQANPSSNSLLKMGLRYPNAQQKQNLSAVNFQRLLPLKDSRDRFKSDHNQNLIVEHEVEHDNEEQQPRQAKSTKGNQIGHKFNEQQNRDMLEKHAEVDGSELTPLTRK